MGQNWSPCTPYYFKVLQKVGVGEMCGGGGGGGARRVVVAHALHDGNS